MRYLIIELIKSKPGTKMVTHEEAASAPIVLIAIGFDHYNKLPLTLLENKVVIDVANSTAPPPPSQLSNAEILQKMIPKAFVVKAFNVLSAYTLEFDKQSSGKQIPVASDHPEAKREVLELVKEMGYPAADYGPLKMARQIEAIPLQLMPNWRIPMLTVSCLWLIHYVVLFVKFQVCGTLKYGEQWAYRTLKHLALLNLNRATAITALWTLTACYTPGLIAAYTQLAWGTKYRRFPPWLDAWLKMRKQLGLIMFLLGSIHTCLGVALWSSNYDPLVWDPPSVIVANVLYNATAYYTRNVTIHDSKMNLQGEIFLTLGTISIFLTICLAVTSLPSVSSSLSWREFSFIQTKLGWSSLIAATIHDGVLGWGYKPEDYKVCGLPSGAQYALQFPILTIALKLPLLIPAVDEALQKIRRGHDRGGSRGGGQKDKPEKPPKKADG
ncbi:metalloreductase STEAP3-like [Penaeus vannamei]|uniref:metalloreductase STEAP3-like n=1 Tax=Penaeus vannamei TaxID=6689 RepID=UPI00387FACD9